MSDMQKLLALTVGGAMFVAAVAPKSQFPKAAGTLGDVWVRILQTLTGNAKLS